MNDPAAAQDRLPPVLDPELRQTQYVYRDWQVEEGLPQNSIFAIEQTSDGYLWLGTQEGLVRFDGVRFTIFDRSRLKNLPGNAVTALLEDGKGGLWIGTDTGGLVRYKNGESTSHSGAEGLPATGIRSLFEDAGGNVWIGTVGGGISLYDGRNFETITTRDGLAGDVVLSIDQDREGNVWAGTNAGISRIRDRKVNSFSSTDGLPGDEVWSIHTSDAGALWVGTNKGLARYRGGSFVPISGPASQCDGTVSDIMEDRAGTLWVATLESGVCRVDGQNLQVFDHAHGLTSDNIRTLLLDREGSVWIGTDGGGLNQIRAGKFAVVGRPEGLSDDMIHNVFEDASGNIWIGTASGGLNRLSKGKIRRFGRQDGLSSEYILTVTQDPAGVLWVGTFDGGLCRLRGDRFECFDREDGLPSNFVRVVYHDSRGEMWIGTDVGLHRRISGSPMSFTTEEGLQDQSVTSIHEDQTGDLWVGTWSGLARRTLDGRMEPVETWSDEPIMTLFEDSHGDLWVGSYGGGLCRRRGVEIKCYDSSDGLFDDSVIQILEDEAGFLWLGSNKGISRTARTDFDKYDAGTISALSQMVFDEHSGLRSRETNGGSQPAAMRASDGRLWFSTLKGAAVIDPISFAANPIAPFVMLEKVVVNDELVSAPNGVAFAPGSRKLEFHYSTASFVAPDLIRFQFRLDPYDDGWTEAGSRREAYYTNLPPGEYTFRVRAANSDGVWSDTEAVLEFKLRPHFFQTSWFYILAALSLLAAAVAVYRLRTRNLKSRERHLSRLVTRQTRELQDQKQELEKLNENLEQEVQRQLDVIMRERLRYERELIAAKEKAEESARFKSNIMSNMSHELRTPLTAILGFGQILSEELGSDHQEFLRYMNNNANRLLQTLDAILELSALQAGSLDLRITDVNLPVVVEQVVKDYADSAAAKGLALIVENTGAPAIAEGDPEALARALRKIVENAVKFTPRGEVRIGIGVEDRNAFVRVKDTGIGIAESFLPHIFEAFKQESDGIARTHEGNGIGLTVAQLFVHAMNGRIEVQSGPQSGACFTVYLKEKRSLRAVAA